MFIFAVARMPCGRLCADAPCFIRSKRAGHHRSRRASLTNVCASESAEAATGKKVVFSFAASMILAKQIEASAGADMFISADSESMDYLQDRNLIAKPTRTNLLGNRLVLVAPADSKIRLSIAPRFKLAEALQGGRLALATVDSVPAGRYGKAALTALGVWDSVKDHLAQGEDVRATLAYVARGEAPLGIVYATDARI
jgi:molybdate transport system substrate-binding protein